MIFTYAAEGIIFLDNERIDAESVSSVPSYASILSFNQFLKKNYDAAMKFIREGGSTYSYDLKIGTSFFIIDSMLNYYQVNHFLSVSAWYDSAPLVNAPPRMGKDRIMDQYEIYLNVNGYELKDGAVQKKATNFIDEWYHNALIFFGKIGEAIGKFFELLTFSIKDHYGANIIPAPVMWVINILFLPLWIILVIEALPIVIAIVHAIGVLLDSVTPLT